MKNHKLILLIIILIVAFTLRIVNVGSIPPGVFDDEANYGYDAWLISQTGKDQWSNFLPLQFKGFGDYHLPVTQYLIVPFVRIFGLNTFAIRLPSVLFGTATIAISFLLVRRLFQRNKNAYIYGLISALMLTFNPWHIALSRTVMEANIGLAFTLLAIYFYLESQVSIKFFSLAMVFTVLSIYTYYGYRLFLVLFFIIITLKNKDLIRHNFKKKILIFVIGLVLIMPALIAFNESGLARLRQVNFWQDKSLLADTNEYRGICRGVIGDNLCKIFFNQFKATGEKFLINYFNHFSPNFLFFPEFEKTWGLLPSANSYFYLLDFVLFIIGLFYLFKENNYYIFLFLLLAPIADSLTDKGNFSRSFILVFPITVCLSVGWVAIYQLLIKKRIVFISLLIIYAYFSVGFFINYFIYLPKKQSAYTHYAYLPLFNYLKQVENQYDHIYLSKFKHDQRQYIFYLYYFQIPSNQYFNMSKEYLIEDNGWVYVTKLDKYNFINQASTLDNYPSKSLLVIDPEGTKYLDGYNKEKANIYYQDGRVAFSIWDIDQLKEYRKNNGYLTVD